MGCPSRGEEAEASERLISLDRATASEPGGCSSAEDRQPNALRAALHMLMSTKTAAWSEAASLEFVMPG